MSNTRRPVLTPTDRETGSRTDAIAMSIRGKGGVDPALKRDIRVRLPAQLGALADKAERVTINFSEGDADESVCRISLALRGMATLRTEARGSSARTAYSAATRKLTAASTRHARGPITDDSVIDRRVGHGPDALGDAVARRRAGANVGGVGATAVRNAKTNTAGMTSMLEDSKTKPSRKSTRRSTNRSKGATVLQQTAQAKTVSPKARAMRSNAKRGSTNTTTVNR